jgi:hypothetical protein
VTPHRITETSRSWSRLPWAKMTGAAHRATSRIIPARRPKRLPPREPRREDQVLAAGVKGVVAVAAARARPAWSGDNSVANRACCPAQIRSAASHLSKLGTGQRHRGPPPRGGRHHGCLGGARPITLGRWVWHSAPVVPVMGAHDGEQRHVGPRRLTRQICRSALTADTRIAPEQAHRSSVLEPVVGGRCARVRGPCVVTEGDSGGGRRRC